MIKLWIILLNLMIANAHALQNQILMRSPRALLMGDAFTAVNDDDFTLFYNPASLGRHKRDLTLYPFNPQFSGSNILNDIDRFKDFPNEPVGASNKLMNFPAYASAGIAPGLKLFNFGMTFLSNESYDILLRNPSHPMMDVDIRSDKGIMMGIGIPIGSDRLSRKSQSGSQTSLGISGKYIERTGLRDTMGITSPTVLDALSRDELNDVLKSLGQVKAIGWGFDAGIEHINRSGNSQVVVGLSALDLTGTEFKEPEINPKNIQVSDIRDQVNLGVATGQDFQLFNYILSADIRGLNEQMDFGKRLRFGAQVGFPGLKLMAGVNSGYYSYGAMLDMGVTKVTAGFYDMELGSKYKQIKSKRFVVYLSLFDFSFDS